MKMSLFAQLSTKYETRMWLKNPELGLIDTLLDAHPELLDYIKGDIMRGQKSSNFGRGDMPSVEQIFRAAIYKETKGLDYRELAEAQDDSRSCAAFIRLDPDQFYSFQMYQSMSQR